MCGERGVATVEWTGLLLIVSLALGGLGSVAGPRVDGRSFGGFMTHAIVCAVRGGCDDGDAELADEYGGRTAALVRAQAPSLVYEPGERSLPVDWRRCRELRCSEAPDDALLDAHRTDSGEPATAFTHVVRRGRETFIQYWLYYPDSNSMLPGSEPLADKLRTPLSPGYHPDDWESVQVRIDRQGRSWVRASSHGHYQACKQRRCRGAWTDSTGWSRVSRGSHAGHIPLDSIITATRLRPGLPPRFDNEYRYEPRYPGRDMNERTTTADGLRLVPITPEMAGDYDPLDPGIKPPWLKEVFRAPRSGES